MRRSVGSYKDPGAWGGLIGGLREREEIYLRMAPPLDDDWRKAAGGGPMRGSVGSYKDS